jgi:peptidyl-prolyl cis-trans isomerase B (cyclophilin B)
VKLNTVAVAALAALALAACAQTPDTPDASDATTRAAARPGFAACDYNVSGRAARPVDPPVTDDVPATGTVNVTLKLSAGDIHLTLDRARTPCTVNSFLSLLEQGYYTDTSCHRLTDSGIFVLQCGDPGALRDGDPGVVGHGGPGYSFANETYADDKYPAGTLAMAHSAQPNSNGSQFFMVYQDSRLDPDYTVFGHFDDQSVAVLETVAAGGSDHSFDDGTGWPNIPVTIDGYAMG